MYKGHVIHVLARMWKDLRRPRTAFSVLGKPERGRQQFSAGLEETGPRISTFQHFAVSFLQLRLVVPRINLTGTTIHYNPDHILHAVKVPQPWTQWMLRAEAHIRGTGIPWVQQRTQGDRPAAETCPCQYFASRELGIHSGSALLHVDELIQAK